MKTGTDISLSECRASGYPVVEHHSKTLDVNKDYHLTISNPERWPYGSLIVGTPREKAYVYDGHISYSRMWELFEEAGEIIKEYCDFKNYPMPSPSEKPDFIDFVVLAGNVFSYSGLN